MKKRIAFIFIIVVLLVTTFVVVPKYKHYIKIEKYIEGTTNYNISNVANNVLFLELLLDNINDKGYFLESDMVFLEQSSNTYIQSMVKLEDISQEIYDFNFQPREYKVNTVFNYEYLEFWQRLKDLYPKEKYYQVPSERVEINDANRLEFQLSYDYIKKSAEIVRNFKEGISEDGYSFKEEISENNLPITILEVKDMDDYKEVSFEDDEWLKLFKEFQKLHIKEK